MGRSKKSDEIDFTKMEKVESISSIVDNKKNYKFYFTYNMRLLTFVCSFIVLVIISCIFIGKSFTISDEKKVEYTEKSLLDYKVVLKDNDFYEDNVLDKNMSYIANLIDKININFNYRFNVDTTVDSVFSYEIFGVLRIVNPNTNEVYFTKQYELQNKKYARLSDMKEYFLTEAVNIDYDYYNELANSFKSTYSLDTDSSFVITLKINRNIKNELIQNNELNNTDYISIKIPLSQKSISIKMDYDDINKHETIISSKNLTFNDRIYIGIGGLLFLVAILILLLFTRTVSKATVKPIKYDKILNKYLKEYDRLIVEITNVPDLSRYDVSKVKSFEELLDLHDNYHEPIRYVEITKHVKSYFYIQRQNEIFLYVLKSVDVEENK